MSDSIWCCSCVKLRTVKTHFLVLYVSVIRHEHYYFLLNYLVILSIHNYTLIYCHYCYIIIIIIFNSFNIC